MLRKVLIVASCVLYTCCQKEDNLKVDNLDKENLLPDQVKKDIVRFSEIYRAAARIDYLHTEFSKQLFENQIYDDCKRYESSFELLLNIEPSLNLENSHYYGWDTIDEITNSLGRIIDGITFGGINQSPVQTNFVKNIKEKIKVSAKEYIESLSNKEEIPNNKLSNFLSTQIGLIEDEIIKSESISIEDKKIMFTATTTLFMNIDNIVYQAEKMISQKQPIYAKTLNWFTRALKATVVAITVAVLFVGVVVGGALAGLYATGGSPLGLAAGVLVGGYFGVKYGVKFVRWIEESWDVD